MGETWKNGVWVTRDNLFNIQKYEDIFLDSEETIVHNQDNEEQDQFFDCEETIMADNQDEDEFFDSEEKPNEVPEEDIIFASAAAETINEDIGVNQDKKETQEITNTPAGRMFKLGQRMPTDEEESRYAYKLLEAYLWELKNQQQEPIKLPQPVIKIDQQRENTLFDCEETINQEMSNNQYNQEVNLALKKKSRFKPTNPYPPNRFSKLIWKLQI